MKLVSWAEEVEDCFNVANSILNKDSSASESAADSIYK